MPRLARFLAVTLLLPLVSACGGGEGAGHSAGIDEGWSVRASLAELPYDEPRGRTQVIVTAGDLERATELAGSERPAGDDADGLAEWLRSLTRDVFVPAPEHLGFESMRSDPDGGRLGFTMADVRSFAELRGGLERFSVQRVDEGVSPREDLPTEDGQRKTGDGDVGSLDTEAIGVGDPSLVQVVVVSGDRVALSTDVAQAEDWEDHRGPRLEQDETLADLADALDDDEVYAAYLVAGSFDQRRGSPPDDAIAEEFAATGLGFDLDDDQPVVHVAYWFRDVEGAADQVESTWSDGRSRRTNRPISDYVTVRDVETDGHVVSVELEVEDPGPSVVLEMLTAADTPFQGGE